MSSGLPGGGDLAARDQLSSVRGLLVLSALMTQRFDEQEILHLSTSAVGSLGPFQAVGVELDGHWMPAAGAAGAFEDANEAAAALRDIGPSGGPVELEGWSWAYAYALAVTSGPNGFLVATASQEPEEHEQFLMRALAHQTAVALANARLHRRDQSRAEELAAAVLALQRSMEIHDRLTRVAVAGEGPQGIAEALFELTGYPTAVEDRFGNLTAWAGPAASEPPRKDSARRREQVLERAIASGRPLRDRGRLIAVAQPTEDLLGVLTLLDPDATAGAAEQIALEHGATLLAIDLARLYSVSEAEFRRRRELLGELLTGTDERHAYGAAQLLGYDLARPHRVVVFERRDGTEAGEHLFNLVRSAARDLNAGSLLAFRSGTVVLLADAEISWVRLGDEVAAGCGRRACHLGVGGRHEGVGDIRRSHREALLALEVQKIAGATRGVTLFDELGIYRLLSESGDLAEVERLVHRWIGELLDYDARSQSELVVTLGAYLECGGNYVATSTALSVHRSTLKYRLRRIREISGHDLADPDTRFHLQLATRAWRTLEVLRQT